MNYEDKIAKLLAKAEGAAKLGNEEEAAAYSTMAEKLMLKYGIEEAKLAGEATDDVVRKQMTFTGSYHKVQLTGVFVALHKLGTCRFVKIDPRRGESRLEIIGHAKDVDRALQLGASLLAQAMNGVASWWNLNKWRYGMADGCTSRDDLIARRSYITGFFNGVASRLRKLQEEAVVEAGTGTEMVLVSRLAKVDAQVTKWYPRMTKGRATNRRTDYGARESGYSEGQRADIGQNRVGR